MKLLLTSKDYKGLYYETEKSDIRPHRYKTKYFIGNLELQEALEQLKYYQIVGIVNIPNNTVCEGYIVYDNINYQGSYVIVEEKQ